MYLFSVVWGFKLMVAKIVLDEIVLHTKGSKDHNKNTDFPYR